MNTSVTRRRRSAALAVLFLLAACGGGASQSPPLAGAALGGPFSLIDQDGRAVTDRSYAGRYRAVYFGYTFCPDVCPTTLATLMQGYKAFAARSPAKAAMLVPIFVTVDPARDTPAVMKKYVAAFGPGLVGLTGSPAEIARVAREYAVSYSKQPAPQGAAGYLMSHSSIVILYGPDGKPIATVPTDQGSAPVADTFSKWAQ